MHPFKYVRPATLDEALALLSEHGPAARVLAGGTDLLVKLRLGRVKPGVVIDLKRIAALRADVTEVDGCLRVGARTVMTDLIVDARIQRHFPALVESAAVVGSIQIRNRATLAGNICNASPAADTAAALLVHDAAINLMGTEGARRVPVADFFKGPGQTALQRGEIVASIDLPVPRAPAGAAFGRVTRRKGVDLATINLCCLVTASGDVRFGYGAVGPRPFLAAESRGALADRNTGDGSRDEALLRLIAEAAPISDIRGGRGYRSAMLLAVSRRALATAHERLQGRV
jgi:CO/xanthine dehydrogenase FAD-binding subunit